LWVWAASPGADFPPESAVEDAIAARIESRDQYRAEIRAHKSAFLAQDLA
jgi:hypothetical protein